MIKRELPARRGAAWIAAAGTAAIIAGVVGCARPVVSQRTGPMTLADASTAPASMAYACRFKAGTFQAGARLAVSYPATTVVGRAVRPASLTLTVTVPAAALASLGPPGTAITVAARLATSGVRTVWASLAAPPVPLPAAGQDLVGRALQLAGPLPSLTATRAGTMTVTAGSLALLFTPPVTVPASTSTTAIPSTSGTPSATVTPSASGTPSPVPSPVHAAAVAAACTLKPGQDAVLATIAVRSATANRAATPLSYCPPLPPGGLKLNRRFPPPPPPPGSTVTYPPPELGCAYVKGYADVRKLNGASLVGPGLINLAIGVRVVYNLARNYFQEDSAAQFDYRPCRTCRIVHGLPPAHATFLAFGFMPVSATLQLTEIGTINIYGVGTASTLTSNTAWSLMALRISDVKVNGQSLAVGPHCQTVQPLLIKLTGVSTGPQPYSLQGGGPLTGQITIPPFTGCGVSENLDPLFTGTVSGPGNYAKFTQGSLCTLIGDLGCPPPIPKPLR